MYVHLSTRNYPTRLNSPTNQGKENWNIQFEFHGALDDQLEPKISLNRVFIAWKTSTISKLCLIEDLLYDNNHCYLVKPTDLKCKIVY